MNGIPDPQDQFLAFMHQVTSGMMGRFQILGIDLVSWLFVFSLGIIAILAVTGNHSFKDMLVEKFLSFIGIVFAIIIFPVMSNALLSLSTSMALNDVTVRQINSSNNEPDNGSNRIGVYNGMAEDMYFYGLISYATTFVNEVGMFQPGKKDEIGRKVDAVLKLQAFTYKAIVIVNLEKIFNDNMYGVDSTIAQHARQYVSQLKASRDAFKGLASNSPPIQLTLQKYSADPMNPGIEKLYKPSSIFWYIENRTINVLWMAILANAASCTGVDNKGWPWDQVGQLISQVASTIPRMMMNIGGGVLATIIAYLLLVWIEFEYTMAVFWFMVTQIICSFTLPLAINKRLNTFVDKSINAFFSQFLHIFIMFIIVALGINMTRTVVITNIVDFNLLDILSIDGILLFLFLLMHNSHKIVGYFGGGTILSGQDVGKQVANAVRQVAQVIVAAATTGGAMAGAYQGAGQGHQDAHGGYATDGEASEAGRGAAARVGMQAAIRSLKRSGRGGYGGDEDTPDEAYESAYRKAYRNQREEDGYGPGTKNPSSSGASSDSGSGSINVSNSASVSVNNNSSEAAHGGFGPAIGSFGKDGMMVKQIETVVANGIQQGSDEKMKSAKASK